MKDKEAIQKREAQLLLNQEVKVVSSWNQDFHGKTGLVRKVMADGRTLEVELAHTAGKIVFLDVTFVREIQERQHSKPKQSLGPIANSVVKDTI